MKLTQATKESFHKRLEIPYWNDKQEPVGYDELILIEQHESKTNIHTHYTSFAYKVAYKRKFTKPVFNLLIKSDRPQPKQLRSDKPAPNSFQSISSVPGTLEKKQSGNIYGHDTSNPTNWSNLSLHETTVVQSENPTGCIVNQQVSLPLPLEANVLKSENSSALTFSNLCYSQQKIPHDELLSGPLTSYIPFPGNLFNTAEVQKVQQPINANKMM